MSSLGPAQRKDLSDAQSEADDQGEAHEAQAHAEAGQPQRRLMHGPGARPQTQHPPSHKKGGSRGSRDKGLIGFWGRKLYRQPTRRGFSAVGTIVTIHRGGMQDRSGRARYQSNLKLPFKVAAKRNPSGYRAIAINGPPP